MSQTLEHEKEIEDFKETLERLRSHQKDGQEVKDFEKKLDDLKASVYAKLSPWERVTICRHPKRPHTVDYIRHICDEFKELAGDRLYGNDPAIIGGLGLIGGQKFVIIGQEKGFDTESRLKRNFGMPLPEGYRKAQRLMKMAEKFGLPVLCLIDTPGAFPALDAEERGQGRAIADNLFVMARLKTPIIIAVIGEGCSGGALGIGVGDVVGMMEHGYYSVISPEGCASILWKDASKREQAAETLKMHAEDLIKFGVIDKVIKEPMGGAHHDPEFAMDQLKAFVLTSYKALECESVDDLLESRYQKFRKLGEFLEG